MDWKDWKDWRAVENRPDKLSRHSHYGRWRHPNLGYAAEALERTGYKCTSLPTGLEETDIMARHDLPAFCRTLVRSTFPSTAATTVVEAVISSLTEATFLH